MRYVDQAGATTRDIAIGDFVFLDFDPTNWTNETLHTYRVP
jgi:hypothetical protein